MAFFDFHIHPALKPQFNSVDQRDSPWTTLKLGLGIIDSQSSLTQLVKGQLNMMGFVLHCPESHMASELGRLLTADDLALKIWRCLDRRTFERVPPKHLLTDSNLSVPAFIILP